MSERTIGSACAALGLTILAAVFCSTGCSYTAASKGVKDLNKEVEITSSLGINVTDGEYTQVYDSHGGFHGDGTTYSTVKFTDDTVLDQIEEHSEDGPWHKLPLSENVDILLYGVEKETENGIESMGPFITDDEGNVLAPEVKNGYYFFMDRQADDEEYKFDDSKVLDRASYNCTVALYDTDTDTLHYFKLDT